MSLYLGSLSTEKRETLIRDIYKYLKNTEKDAFKVLQEYIQTNKALPPKYYIKINKKPKIIFSWKKAHERYYDHRITYHETDEAYLIHKDDWDYISKGVQEMFQRETELNSTGVQSNYEYEI